MLVGILFSKYFFFFYLCVDHPTLHVLTPSFPARRSSDHAQDTRGPQPRLAAHGGAVRLGSQPAQAEAVRDRLARGRRGRTGAAPSRTAGPQQFEDRKSTSLNSSH